MYQDKEILANVYGHENIFKQILNFLAEATIARTIDGTKAYLESCYISKRLFTRLSSGSRNLSNNELVWLPTTKIGVYQMIFSIEKINGNDYYNINLIADGGDVTHFVGVSGTSYFFMDEGEKLDHKE